MPKQLRGVRHRMVVGSGFMRFKDMLLLLLAVL